MYVHVNAHFKHIFFYVYILTYLKVFSACLVDDGMRLREVVNHALFSIVMHTALPAHSPAIG